jgi:hypothetical protein
MENAAPDADLKYYVDENGVRPDIVIAFLDVYAARGGRTNGVIFAVEDHKLLELDRREVRYERVEVTSQISSDDVAPRRVWTYCGQPRSRDVLREGKASGRAFVSRGYRDYCRSGFARGGDDSVRAFEATTDPLDLPLRELTMVTPDDD